MTLFRQIALIFTFFLVIVLGVVIKLNFKTANDFVQNALYTNAQDTATSLGLSLNSVINQNDLGTMDTMISAIFDRGYYESITLYDANNKVLISKKNKLKVKGVPEWFIKFVSLKTPPAYSGLSNGWIPFGKIEVINHPGDAYLQLWNTLIDLFISMLILGIVVLSILFVLLKFVLKPLKKMEIQAKAINDNDFIVNDFVPYTIEFKHVVKAMNSMILKVKEIFEKEAETLKKYYKILYTDSESGLNNRRYLMTKIPQYLNSENELSKGSFALISVTGLDNIKNEFGYKKFQETINTISNNLKENFKDIPEGIIARMNKDDFSIFLPMISAMEVGDRFNALIKNPNKDYFISIGVINYYPANTIKEIFSKADFVLSKAKIKQQNSIEFDTEDDNSLTMGKEEWIKVLEGKSQNIKLKLSYQPVVDITTKQVYHNEIYLRLSDNIKNKIYNAGYFIPVFVNLNLLNKLDKFVIQNALKINLNKITINITKGFLLNTQNLVWLKETLKQKNKELEINFEASNYVVLNNIQLFLEFSKILKESGCGFGIDNFSLSNNLTYLREVKPLYIKIDKETIFDLFKKGDGVDNALLVIANSLNITIIATSVEHENEIQTLKEYGIKKIQGSIISKPKLIGD